MARNPVDATSRLAGWTWVGLYGGGPMGLFRRKPSVDPAQLAAVAADVAALRTQLATLVQRLDAAESDRRDAAAVVAGLQQRVESIGTELTHQLTELSGEIDVLHQRPDPASLVDALGTRVAEAEAAATRASAATDGLQSGQERLANEQARYQIAFREDLAALAEQTARRRAERGR